MSELHKQDEITNYIRTCIEAQERNSTDNFQNIKKKVQKELRHLNTQRKIIFGLKIFIHWAILLCLAVTKTHQPIIQYLVTFLKAITFFNSNNSLANLFENIKTHNEVFPANKYEFVAFTGFENGNSAPYVEPIFKQLIMMLVFM